MPGYDDRSPSGADRPPASRVGAELQDRIDDEQGEIDAERVAEIEAEAMAAAREKMWDQPSTAREGGVTERGEPG